MNRSDAFGRLHAMISDKHGKWDLSPNDVEALRVVYGTVAKLRTILEGVLEAVAPVDCDYRCLLCGTNHIEGDDPDTTCDASQALQFLRSATQSGGDDGG